MDSIITGDETWSHHYEPESKRQSMAPLRLPSKKVVQDADICRQSDVHRHFRQEEHTPPGFLEPGATVSSNHYVETLTEGPDCPCKAREKGNNTRPYTGLKTTECVTKFGWKMLSRPQYSPNLALSDFHLLGPLKDLLCGQRFPDNNAVISAVKKWTTSVNQGFSISMFDWSTWWYIH